MTTNENKRFTVISSSETEIITKKDIKDYSSSPTLHTNPMYEKLLNFRNLQEAQKKRFTVDDLFKLC